MGIPVLRAKEEGKRDKDGHFFANSVAKTTSLTKGMIALTPQSVIQVVLWLATADVFME